MLPLVVEEGVGEPLLSLPGVGILELGERGEGEHDRCLCESSEEEDGESGEVSADAGERLRREVGLLLHSRRARESEWLESASCLAPHAEALDNVLLCVYFFKVYNELRSTEESLHKHLSNTLHCILRHCFRLRSTSV